MNTFAEMLLGMVLDGYEVVFHKSDGEKEVKITISKGDLINSNGFAVEELYQRLMSVDSFMSMKTKLTKDKILQGVQKIENREDCNASL